MPKEIVHIDLQADTAPRRQDTDVAVGVIGTMHDDLPGDVSVGEVYRATDPADVSDEYGEDTDFHVASQAISEMGARHWYVLALEATEHEDEEVESGDSVEYTPIVHDQPIEVDGYDVEYSTADPIEDEDVDEGTVHINTESGQVVTGDGEAAMVSYSSGDFDEALEELDDVVDRLGFANQRVTRKHIGVLDAMAQYVSEQEKGFVYAYEDADELESKRYAQELAWDVGEYVPSGEMAAFSHRGSDDDVASYKLGLLATQPPWFDFMYYDDGIPVTARDWPSRKIGNPRLSGTLEGGDPEDQRGPSNVIIEQTNSEGQDVWVASNSLTTAGQDSDYVYFDIAMTQFFIAQEVRAALTRARMKNDQIPYTEDGRDIVKNVITDTVQQYVGGTGQPLSAADVVVPEHDELDESTRAERRWTGIEIDATLAGNVHEFVLRLTVGV